MIKFSLDDTHHRPDVVNLCSNCGEISAAHFIVCPACKHKPLKKKAIKFYTDDLRGLQVPCLIVSKSELINRFVPGKRAEVLTDDLLIKISDKMRQMILDKMPNLYIAATYKVLGENTIKETSGKK